jgi:hypothetical protein
MNSTSTQTYRVATSALAVSNDSFSSGSDVREGSGSEDITITTVPLLVAALLAIMCV